MSFGQAGFALLLALNFNVGAELQAAVAAAITVGVALFVRTQVTADVSAR